MSTVNVNRVVDASGGVLAPISSVMRNRLINGSFAFDQRNAGASVTPSNDQYTLDRWVCGLTQASKYSVQQNAGSVTPPAGFTNYLGVTSLAATSLGASDFFILTQRLEGFNVADLGWGTANARTVTLSFWVRSSLIGTFGGVLNNSANDRSYPFTYTISAANTWEYKTVTVAGDTTGTWLTTNGVGINLRFSLGSGSSVSGTAGAWAGSFFTSVTGATSVVGTDGATFYITGVQLEVGTQATSFEYRQYQQELALCQRYYQGASGSASNTLYVFTSQAVANNFAVGNYQPFVPMRATPVISYNNIAASNSTGGSSGATVVAIEAGSTGQALRVAVTGGTGLTAGNASIIGLPSSASFFNLSAEL